MSYETLHDHDAAAELPFWDVPLEPERYELHEQPQKWGLAPSSSGAVEDDGEQARCLSPLLRAGDPNSTVVVNRRDLLRIAGGGLVVALVLDAAPADAQQPRRGRRGFGGFGGGPVPQEIGAWLHIAEDGTITAYTGKTEIGQNIRTSLAQAVADELRVPAERVRMVMADTQLVPFDGGTAGSRTTPAMAPQLRRVAAAAREALLDLAAEQAKVTRDSLAVKDGRIVETQSGRTFEYGQLTKGAKLTKPAGRDAATTPVDKWTTAGTSVPKSDGRAMVTGVHKFASDTHRPGMQFGKVLRPASFKATLETVDTKAAEELPGVKVVHDGDFVGVVAPTALAAEEALTAIRAQWKSTPQISSNELFAHLKQRAGASRGGFGRSSDAGQPKSTPTPDAVMLQATYTVTYIAHCPLEPRAAVAEFADGKLTVWTGTQRPFGVRGELAEALGMPAESVRVIVPDMGSGYGGKHTGEAAVEAARLAKAAGKPVKVVWTREEEFTWAYFRPAGVIDVSSAATKDGKLISWEFHNYNSGGSAIRSPYDVPQRSEFHQSDSPLRQGSYRALAATANHFARESHMDELAHELHLDPLAFRLKNLKDERLRAVLEAASRQFDWGRVQTSAGQGCRHRWRHGEGELRRHLCTGVCRTATRAASRSSASSPPSSAVPSSTQTT